METHAKALTGTVRRSPARLVGTTMLLLLLLQNHWLQFSVVRGASMEPCLHDGDRLVVDRLGCAPDSIKHGDVVVLRCPQDPGLDFVKRVVGLPGDELLIRDGQLYRNGNQVLDYDCYEDGCQLPVLRVPAGHIYVLGDNRPISCDSREFGLVPVGMLKGRVAVRYWPPGHATVF